MFKGIVRSGLALGLTLAFSLMGLAFAARAPQAAQQKPAYTYAEYNAYQAAAKETNPQQRIQLLDQFVSKFPNSTLMPYVDQLYYKTYDSLKQYNKVITYADKLVSSTSKEVDNGMKLQALYAREVAFNYTFDPKAANATQQAQTAGQDAAMGLKLLNGLTKPANMTEAQFNQQKQAPAALFNYTEGYASLILKNYPAAEKSFVAALKVDPTNPANAVTYFRLGVAYLAQASQEQASAAPATTPGSQASSTTPPSSQSSNTTAPPATGTGADQQSNSSTGAGATQNASAQQAPLPGPSAGQPDFMKGFWALARSIALGGSTVQEVQSYLQNQMLVYQKTACQNLLTNEMNNLLQMAKTTQTVDPPAGYALPSGVQLSEYLQSSNLFNIMQDLQAGGDRANFVWLAVCGNEFPQVPVKVISVTQTSDGVDMQVYTGPTPKDIQAATTANMEVVVTNQPAAQRLKKDNIVRFTGTLASYDPPPNFLLHWSNAQVNPADIPPSGPAGRRGRRG
jgi:tetratricopeptide (TPR) repeat protein